MCVYKSAWLVVHAALQQALGAAHHCVALRRLPGVRIVWDLMLRAPIFYPAFGESRMNEETKLISDRKLEGKVTEVPSVQLLNVACLQKYMRE